MSRKHLPLFVLTLFLQLANAQIPNNGFENWTNMGSYLNPDNWSSLNDLTAGTGVFTCQKGTPGYSGAAYLKLTSKTVSGMGIVTGIAVSGTMDNGTLQPLSGFPYTQRAQQLIGNWQYMAFGNDQGYIDAMLTRWNSGTGARETIASIHYGLPGMVMSWDNFVLDFTYYTDDQPDSAMIVFSASGFDGAPAAVSSYIYMDNLWFSGTVAGLQEQAVGKIEVSPNPVINNLAIRSTTENGSAEYSIFSVDGKIVETGNVLFPKSTIDVGSLKDGIYSIQIREGEKHFVKRFLKTGF